MECARYEILPNNGGFYGEIPECIGVYSHAETLKLRRREMDEILEEWTVFQINKNLPLPTL